MRTTIRSLIAVFRQSLSPFYEFSIPRTRPNYILPTATYSFIRTTFAALIQQFDCIEIMIAASPFFFVESFTYILARFFRLSTLDIIQWHEAVADSFFTSIENIVKCHRAAVRQRITLKPEGDQAREKFTYVKNTYHRYKSLCVLPSTLLLAIISNAQNTNSTLLYETVLYLK